MYDYNEMLKEFHNAINDDVINNINDIDNFEKLWINYEAKNEITLNALHKIFLFFSYFKLVIFKSENSEFILIEGIFEDTLLNNTFHVHIIPISPNYALGLISKDIINKATQWSNFFRCKL